MTIVASLLMILGMPLQDPPPHSEPVASDSTRVAIAQAALEHAVLVATEDMGVPMERVFLSLGIRSDRIDPREWAGNDTAAFVAVAEEHGFEIRHVAEHPAYVACHRQGRRSEACQIRRGTTSLSILRAGVIGAEHAFAWITIRTIPGADGSLSSLRFQELKLEKVGDAWKVVSVVQVIDA